MVMWERWRGQRESRAAYTRGEDFTYSTGICHNLRPTTAYLGLSRKCPSAPRSEFCRKSQLSTKEPKQLTTQHVQETVKPCYIAKEPEHTVIEDNPQVDARTNWNYISFEIYFQIDLKFLRKFLNCLVLLISILFEYVRQFILNPFIRFLSRWKQSINIFLPYAEWILITSTCHYGLLNHIEFLNLDRIDWQEMLFTCSRRLIYGIRRTDWTMMKMH